MTRLRKLLLLALGLIVVAIIVNLTDPTHSVARLLKGETKVQAQMTQHFGPSKPIAPVGSETAKVKVKVFAQSGNQCHEPTIGFFQKMGEALPSRIRVVFVESASKEGFDARQKAGISCESGFLINDKRSFEMERDGKKVTLHTGGPIGMEVPPVDAIAALTHELKAQYGKTVSQQELDKLKAAWEKPAPSKPAPADSDPAKPAPATPAKEEKGGAH